MYLGLLATGALEASQTPEAPHCVLYAAEYAACQIAQPMI